MNQQQCTGQKSINQSDDIGDKSKNIDQGFLAGAAQAKNNFHNGDDKSNLTCTDVANHSDKIPTAGRTAEAMFIETQDAQLTALTKQDALLNGGTDVIPAGSKMRRRDVDASAAT